MGNQQAPCSTNQGFHVPVGNKKLECVSHEFSGQPIKQLRCSSIDQPDEAQRKVLEKGFLMWTNLSKKKEISRAVFEEHLFADAPVFGGILFEYLFNYHKVGVGSQVENTLDQVQYVRAGLRILIPLNSSQINLFYRIFSISGTFILKKEVFMMLHACHDIMRMVIHLGDDDKVATEKVLAAVVDSLFDQSDELSVIEFSQWFEQNCSHLFDGIYQITCAILSGEDFFTSQTEECDAQFAHQVAASRNLLTSASFWLLTSSLPATYIPTGGDGAASAISQLPMVRASSPSGWHLLYDTNEQGLSIRGFQHHVFDYKGCTIMFISFKGHVYCVTADTEWREGRQRFGGTDCCLFQILPTYTLMQSGRDMLYVNFSDRTARRGVKFGKDDCYVFLSIDEDLSKVNHYGVSLDLYRIQVWGCSGNQTREAQQQQKEWEKKQALKSKDRKMKLEDWENNPDRQLLDMGGVTTDHAQR